MLHKLITRHAVVLALACILPGPVSALDLPKHSRADSRIRYANYNPADVIQLDAVIGVATHIVLEENEEYVYHVFGDSEAYAFTHKANHLFFKPVADDADTNLIVVTNRRNYTFRISYSPNPKARALYKLVLRYPDTEAQRTHKAAEKSAIKTAFQQAGPINWQSYSKSGDMSLAPVHAWDDGRQTWMQFSQTADIPAVYRVTADGQEVITNYHMADERTMVLHRTASKWHIRLGSQVAAIHNASAGLAPEVGHTGTTSPNVRRVIQGSDANKSSLTISKER
ncbi:TrbG/VirB9 family P-type conjugative transfer protein [Alcaligenaceae bacterium CGII-47]|nr:TrbG/VirB9 family P-type conjugative transfer protein [Alcaligenaceae bacterium CGII-47]